MKKILITGGAVYAHLDAVKIITNGFKGGRMVKLAGDLFLSDDSIRVTYLTSKGLVVPPDGTHPFIKVIFHNGFEDYRKKVLELAPRHDAVILGAAVCNLIPLKPWKKKFPSHNYKVGDKIPIDFTIAPRVIDEVKKVAPKVHLFGFKLLKGVPHKELINAAYDVLLESKATAVFANDATDLDTRYAVTKEGGEIKFSPDRIQYGMVDFILNCVSDKYYSTSEGHPDFDILDYRTARIQMMKLTNKYKSKFKEVYGKRKYKFGTVAVRTGKTDSFVTTKRGKREMSEIVFVETVDHKLRKVFSYPTKATLNAPLLHKIFKNRPNVKAIVHYHKEKGGIAWCPYAPSGTVRDASVGDSLDKSWKAFDIEGHGTFELIQEENI